MDEISNMLYNMVKPGTTMCDLFLNLLAKNSGSISEETIINHYDKLDWIAILKEEEGYKAIKLLFSHYDQLSTDGAFNSFFSKLLDAINTNKSLDTDYRHFYINRYSFGDRNYYDEAENKILYTDELILVLDAFKLEHPDDYNRHSVKEWIPVDFRHLCKSTVPLEINFIMRQYDMINWDSVPVIKKTISKKEFHHLIPEFISYRTAAIFLLNDNTIFYHKDKMGDFRSIQHFNLKNFYIFPSEQILDLFENKQPSHLLMAGIFSSTDPYKILKQYKDFLDWDTISSDPANEWNLQCVLEFSDKINWWNFCSGNSFFRNHSDIEAILPFIKWESLSSNRNCGIDLKLIEKYSEYWNYFKLLMNTSIPFDFDFLSNHLDFLVSSEIFSNPNIIPNINFIEAAIRLYNNRPTYVERGTTFCYMDNGKFFKSGLWNWLSLNFAGWNDEIFITYIEHWNLPNLLQNDHFFRKIILPKLNENNISDILSEHWENSLISGFSGYTNLLEIYSERDLLRFIDKTGNFNSDDVLEAGRYKNKSIGEIIEIDLEYILQLIIEDEFFCLSLELFKEIGNTEIYKLHTPISTIKLYEKAKRLKQRLDLNYDIREERANRAADDDESMMRSKEEQRQFNEQAEQGFNEAYEIYPSEDEDW